jgi:hypothetical protein
MKHLLTIRNGKGYIVLSFPKLAKCNGYIVPHLLQPTMYMYNGSTKGSLSTD